jgi:hypothetical protein
MGRGVPDRHAIAGMALSRESIESVETIDP